MKTRLTIIPRKGQVAIASEIHRALHLGEGDSGDP